MKFLADPVAWVWIGLLLGAAACFAKRRWQPAIFLLCLVIIGSVSATLNLPARLLAGLERPYLVRFPLNLETTDAVVVPGGNLDAFPNSLLGIELHDSIDRLATAIELVRQGKARALVLGGSGGGQPPRPAEGQAAARWVRSWNLVPTPVEVLPPSKNTHDEALHALALARQRHWKSLIIVTSAWHMRRALATFRKAGLDVVPVGSDFQGTAALLNPDRPCFIPRTGGLVLLNLWLGETLGYFYYRIRGWT
jgi:uncharacterized SAM-binding protein YcdF (DUF218 family)